MVISQELRIHALPCLGVSTHAPLPCPGGLPNRQLFAPVRFPVWPAAIFFRHSSDSVLRFFRENQVDRHLIEQKRRLMLRILVTTLQIIFPHWGHGVSVSSLCAIFQASLHANEQNCLSFASHGEMVSSPEHCLHVNVTFLRRASSRQAREQNFAEVSFDRNSLPQSGHKYLCSVMLGFLLGIGKLRPFCCFGWTVGCTAVYPSSLYHLGISQ
jgi:hypothetical protein